MNIRLSYLKRGAIGDGVNLAESFDISILPHIGDHVFLPPHLCEKIAKFHPEGQSMPSIPTRRFEVVSLEHRWESIGQEVFVFISTLSTSET